MAAQPKPLPVEGPSYLEGGGILGWLTTVDHKRIAVLYGVTALLLMMVGGFEALLIRTQLMRPDNHVLTAAWYNQIFTMHGTTMIFLVIMPLEMGFLANFFIPLQIGARDVAFPRINALSYWIFLVGAIFLHLGLLSHVINLGATSSGLPNAGWFGYANLTEPHYSPGLNIDFWDIGLIILGISSLLAALNFFVTIVNMRAPGMTFMRMPMFMWAMLVTTILILLAFPVLTVGLMFLFLDRFFDTHFYRVVAGATPILWQHLFWIFGHPEVYIMALPAFGMISEILPVFSRKPLFGYPMMAYSLVLIAFLSYGVWGHHMFATGMGPIADATFAITSMLIAIPTGIKVFSWIATVWGGRLRFTTAMLFGLAFIAEFTIGGLSGIMHASAPIDLQQTDSYFVVAHFHYVLGGGVLFAILAALYYWWPKMFGRMLDETLGKWQFWLLIIGFNLTFFPMHWLGAWGMPRRIYTYPPGMGWTTLNFIETIGAYIQAVSFIIFFANLLISWRRGEKAVADPWDGRTLEWTVPSPPPAYNFAVLPEGGSRDDFWVQKYGALAGSHGGGSPAPAAVAAAHAAPEGHGKHIHLPAPSFYPPLFALGVFLMGIGALVWLRIVIIGGLLVALSIIGMAFEYPRHGEETAEDEPVFYRGVDSRKAGMWAFLGSECVFFTALISTYMVYKSRNLGGPDAQILNIPLTSLSTFILLMSSLLMVLALGAFRRGDDKWGRIWLLSTAGFGCLFLAGQAFEFTDFYMHGLYMQTNLFGQTFYTLVGTHGCHVLIGVCWLVTLAIAGFMGKIDSKRSLAVEIAGLYWHFVDVVWIVIFTLVYLMRTVKHA